MRHKARQSDHDLASEMSDEHDDEEQEGLLLVKLPQAPRDNDDDDDDENKNLKRRQSSLPLAFEFEEEEEDHLPTTSTTVVVDPHAADLGGTLPSAASGIIKGMVGPAILYLPHGFASAGYLVAVPMLLFSTTLFLWSSACLLECWRVESERVANSRGSGNNRRRRMSLSYPELARLAFGPNGEKLVQVGISLMQSGVCLTYLIFVPQNLRASALLLFDWDISTNWTLAVMVAVQIRLSWIRDIRRLTLTNMLANGLILYGLITCLIFAAGNMNARVEEGAANDNGSGLLLHEAIHRMQSLNKFNPSGWFLFLGTSVLLFEGSITLLVPLQEAVQTDVDRRKFPHMYRKVILGIVSFYTFFGITCWMAFGDGVRTVMTTSLPPGKMAASVQLAYSLAVVFTFPLQNFPSLEIICVEVEKRMMMLATDGNNNNNKALGGGGDYGNNARRNAISTILVIALSIVALLTMDHLDKVVSLMGSMLGCPLAFVLPPLIQNRLDKGQLLGEWRRRMNIAVALLGVVAMVVSSAATILNWG